MMVTLRDTTDLYSLVREGQHPMATDLTLRIVDEQGRAGMERRVHWTTLGAQSKMIAAMAGAGMQEQETGAVDLHLPAHTAGLIDQFLAFCYNHKLTIPLADDDAQVVDLSRLADYMGCESLMRLLTNSLIKTMKPKMFSEGVKIILARLDLACGSLVRTFVKALPKRDEMGSWFDEDSYGVCEAILSLAVQGSGAVFLLDLCASEISAAWCVMPAIAALPASHFATLLAFTNIRFCYDCPLDVVVSEQLISDLILSYLDRRQLPIEGEVAQQLFGFVDMSMLARDYIETILEPRWPPAARELLLDMSTSARPLPFWCPVTLTPLMCPVRLPCEHVIKRSAVLGHTRRLLQAMGHAKEIKGPIGPISFCPLISCGNFKRTVQVRERTFADGEKDSEAVDESGRLAEVLMRKCRKRKRLIDWTQEHDAATPAAGDSKPWLRFSEVEAQAYFGKREILTLFGGMRTVSPTSRFGFKYKSFQTVMDRALVRSSSLIT
jgi:hypothetical protein